MGDTIVLRKAGDVIPEVVSVIKELRPKGTKSISSQVQSLLVGETVVLSVCLVKLLIAVSHWNRIS